MTNLIPRLLKYFKENYGFNLKGTELKRMEKNMSLKGTKGNRFTDCWGV